MQSTSAIFTIGGKRYHEKEREREQAREKEKAKGERKRTQVILCAYNGRDTFESFSISVIGGQLFSGRVHIHTHTPKATARECTGKLAKIIGGGS